MEETGKPTSIMKTQILQVGFSKSIQMLALPPSVCLRWALHHSVPQFLRIRSFLSLRDAVRVMC